MARQFGDIRMQVPLGVTWEQQFQVLDDGGPIDISGYAVLAQIRNDASLITNGVPNTPPVMELTTPAYHASAPAWPSFEAFAITAPTAGQFSLRVDIDDLWTVSPDNESVVLCWAIVLVDGGYRAPVIEGDIAFIKEITL